jgi:hypothetical protein
MMLFRRGRGSRLEPLLLLGLSLLGGLLGVGMSRPIDLIFGIQAEIIGIVSGVIAGTLLLQNPAPLVRIATTAASIVLVLGIWPGFKHVIPSVVAAMVLAAVLGSLFLNWLLMTFLRCVTSTSQ